MNEHPDIHLEKDRLSGKSVALVIAVSLIVTAVSIWIAWIVLEAGETSILGERRVPTTPPRAGETISGIHQTPIAQGRGWQAREEARAALSRFEWVDRDRGTVRIPIERAMELRAKGVKP